jgi:lysyl-tRNA synthetase, class I
VAQAQDGDWVAEIADQVIAEAERRAPGQQIVLASGISPSGPVHLGNLRELMVPHLVADEIVRRGVDCRHLLSWDDYDRLRKVPFGVPESFSEHIGRPLTAVPDPCDQHESWAEHFKAPLQDALARLGVAVDGISQTAKYLAGDYREQILIAMRERETIGAVLDRYRTAEPTAADDEDGAPAASARAAYYPYKPYCQTCNRDMTSVTGYDDGTTLLTYTCSFGHEGSFQLRDTDHGKLVWKVDWPMRWAYEGVTSEAGGVDHSSPGSSFVVGSELVGPVFGGQAPLYIPYSFVGTPGAAKMSSSKGGVPTPSDALDILEAPILRWLYTRRRPKQSFTVAFDQELSRVYDEWDALGNRIAAGTAKPVDVAVYGRSLRTSTLELPSTPLVVPFRTLASIADVTSGDQVQMLRILNDLGTQEVSSLDQVRPRLDRAAAWVREYMPDEDRTQVRTEPDTQVLAALAAEQRQALTMLLEGLGENWSLDGLTGLVYGVPKLQAGLPLDTKPTPELKLAQRAFFALLYELLVSRDTGPRLPTLLLSIGQDRIRRLLTV